MTTRSVLIAALIVLAGHGSLTATAYASVSLDIDSPTNATIASPGGVSPVAGQAIGDVNGDGRTDMVVTRQYSTDGSGNVVDAGSVAVVFSSSVASDVDASNLGPRGFLVTNTNGWDDVGRSAASLGDINADGYDDFALSAPFADTGGRTDNGAVIVIYGKPGTASVDASNLGSQGIVIHGAQSGDRFGEILSPIADQNADGRDDLIASSPYRNGGRGEVDVVAMPTVNTDLATNPGAVTFAILGTYSDYTSNIGLSIVRAGDQNADGREDIALTGEGYNPDGTYANAVYVVYSQTGATMTMLDAPGALGFRLDLNRGVINHPSTPFWSEQGPAIANVGDQNNDGKADLAVGAPRADILGRDAAGKVVVAYSPAAGAILNLDAIGLDGFVLAGGGTNDGAGVSVSAAGDHNGDGKLDILVANSISDSADQSAAYVVGGATAGQTRDLSDLGFAGFALRGGCSCSADIFGAGELGDLDNDGISEFYVSAPYGRVRIVYSAPRPTATTQAASGVGDSSAQLNGIADPNYPAPGKTVQMTTYFDYGSDATYGQQTPLTSAPSDGTPIAAAAPLTGLVSGATYHYRVVAYNDRGLISYGQDRTVTPTGGLIDPPIDDTPDDTTPDDAAPTCLNPIITGIEQPSAMAGERVAISGTGFGPGGQVSFGATVAKTESWTPTLIVAFVPAGATGPVVVSCEDKRSGPHNFDVLTPRNLAPIARATVLPAGKAGRYRLDARTSSDPDGHIVGYRWTYKAKTISKRATFIRTGLKPGKSYQFRVRVTDNQGASDRANVTVRVPKRGARKPPVKQTFSSDALFGFDQCSLTARAKRAIATLRQAAKGSRLLRIEGHADSTGPTDYNQRLSVCRASAVRDALLRGISAKQRPQRVVTRGYGEGRPAVSNATPRGRAKNRRVSVIIIPR